MSTPQTHKTIIFEKFTDDQKDLRTILDSNPTGDNLVQELEKLTVHNFDEFMKKFAPKIYEVTGRDTNTGSIKFFYTTDPRSFKNWLLRPVEIADHAFYKMLAKLYSTRGVSGQANIQFNDEEILETLTPKKTVDEARDLRKKFDYNLERFYEAKARGDRGEMTAARNEVKTCRKKIAEYATSSLTKLLPILIEDTKNKLKLLGAGDPIDGTPEKLISPVDYGKLCLNAAGQIDVDKSVPALAAPKDESTSLVVQDNSPNALTILPADTSKVQKTPVPDAETRRQKIAETVIKDYNSVAEKPNEQIRSLIVSTFAPLATTNTDEKLDVSTLVTRQKGFEDAYAGALQSFANEMARIVESLLGVKTFFDHATTDGGEFSEIPGGVIISNCKASSLLGIKDKFKAYMKLLGKETGDSRLWFAVVPAVLENPPEKIDYPDGDDDDPLSDPLDDDIDEKNSSDDDYVSISAVKEFLGVMNEAKIMTVFNVRVENDNTFANLSASEIEKQIKTFEPCNFAHAVYAYPNFTLMNERDFSAVESKKVKLPAILIDASYPAAGLLVASQQPKILETRKLKLDTEVPDVAIDFEDIRVKKKLPTKFNRESILRRAENVNKAINQNMFGFNFCGDEVKDEGGTWKNSYVHCARTLAKLKNSDLYKPIFQTLTEDYIAQRVDLLTSKKKSFVQKEIAKLNGECADKNGQQRYSDCVNLLLRNGEEIRLVDSGDKIKLIVHFAGGDSYVDIEVESD